MIRVLKNRFCGSIGDAGTLIYDRNTGRLNEFDLAFLNQTETEQGENDNERTDEITV
jgi:hypothetical protein